MRRAPANSGCCGGKLSPYAKPVMTAMWNGRSPMFVSTPVKMPAGVWYIACAKTNQKSSAAAT